MTARPPTPALVLPAAVATYPALFVASGSVAEYSLLEFLSVCVTGLVIGSLTYVVLAILWRRRAVPDAISVAAAFANAFLFCAVILTMQVARLSGRWVTTTLLLGALASAASAGWLSRRPHFTRGVRKLSLLIVTSLSAMAVAVIVVGGVRGTLRYRGSRVVRDLRRPLPLAAVGSARPDVYLIILDNLANAEVMKRVYRVSDAAFVDSLRSLGFIVPRATRSNYSYTGQSVASLLNAGHIRALEADLGASAVDRGVLFRLAQDNRVSDWFRRSGYAVYFQPSIGFAGTSRNASATGSYLPRGFGGVRFVVARSDLLRAYLEPTVPGRVLTHLGFAWLPGDVRLAPLRTVASVADRPGPKFVIAHALSAHEPFTFDSLCNDVAEPASSPETTRLAYVAAARCTEREILSSVRDILARSSTPPVIVLQADHGPRTLGAPIDGPPGRITPDQARERMGAFGAYYLPRGSVPDLVTPVNAFRYVLRYLGAPVTPEPDSAFFSSYGTPYQFVNVTGYLSSLTDSSVGAPLASH